MNLSLRDQGRDPYQQNWLFHLTGWLQPSVGDRIMAGFLAFLLVLATFIGSVITSVSVREAGLQCGGSHGSAPTSKTK